jgi:hypothetical protein
MSSGVKEFLRKSNVEIQTTPSPTATVSSSSTNTINNQLSRNIEMQMLRNQQFPNKIENSIVNNNNYGEFAQFVYDSNDNNTSSTPSPVRNVGLVMSKLNPGMFNATVNKHFSSGSRIDLKKILMVPIKPKTPIGDGLYIETKEIKGIYGRFQTGFISTKNYGQKGSLNRNYFSVQFTLDITIGNEKKGVSVNFYKNGKIRFSGGFVGTNIERQADLIRNYMVNTYTAKESFLYNPFEYNNLSGQFRVNGYFKNFNSLYSRFLKKYGGQSGKYEPELSPFMYLTYKDHKFILASSGNIQISGSTTPERMVDAYNKGMELMRMFHESGEIIITGNITNNTIVQNKKKVKSKVPKKLTPSQIKALKVDGKQCMRMPKPQLLHLAKTLGVVGIKNTTKKEEICKKIKAITNTKTTSFRNTNKNKNVSLSGTNKTFKVGRSICSNYSKTELIRIAKILGIKVEDKDTKISLCTKIEQFRNKKVTPKPVNKATPKPSRKEVAQKKRNVKKDVVIKKRRLDEKSIKNDIVKLYGKRWMNKYKNVIPSINQDVKNVKSRLNTIKKTNKTTGVPFKRDADLIKKRMVNRWKRERERDLERKIIMTQINTRGINKNLANTFRRDATNYIMTHGPTKKQLEKYKNLWINLRKK